MLNVFGLRRFARVRGAEVLLCVFLGFLFVMEAIAHLYRLTLSVQQHPTPVTGGGVGRAHLLHQEVGTVWEVALVYTLVR